MLAFKDKSIKAIFSCIGGYESIRMLPFIDFDIIINKPKILIGFSDTTITDFVRKAHSFRCGMDSTLDTQHGL